MENVIVDVDCTLEPNNKEKIEQKIITRNWCSDYVCCMTIIFVMDAIAIAIGFWWSFIILELTGKLIFTSKDIPLWLTYVLRAINIVFVIVGTCIVGFILSLPFRKMNSEEEEEEKQEEAICPNRLLYALCMILYLVIIVLPGIGFFFFLI